MKNTLLLSLGMLFFGIGAVGAALPVLPTTPFLLVSAACFAQGSPRFNRWFLSTALYKNYLDSFVKQRAMTQKTKLTICLTATAMLLCAYFSMQSPVGRGVILAVIAAKYLYFIFCIDTLKEE